MSDFNLSYKSISILGCGWFGLPLAIALKEQGYLVKGSAQTLDKTALLQTLGIDAHHIQLHPENAQIDPFFFDHDVLLLNIPPERRFDIVGHYTNLMHMLLPVLSDSKNLKGIIFVSSTSVYPDKDQVVQEDCFEKPDKPSGLALLVAENFLKKNLSIPVTSLRFAGLIGPDRFPSNFLAGKKDLKRGNAPVNLIHRADCISATIELLKKPLENEIYNICSDYHPTRKNYYIDAARKAGLEPPIFQEAEATPKGKIISNQKFKSAFPNWQIKFNDLTIPF